MMRNLAGVILLICISLVKGRAQDTLPRFSATTKGNGKTLISWTNNYPVVSQISIQRSLDSTKNFQTILTVPDPSVLQNGFVDTKAVTPFMFYRIFIVMDSGRYVFTRSHRPTWDTAQVVADATPAPPPSQSAADSSKRVVIAENVIPPPEIEKPVKVERKAEPEKFYLVKRRDSVVSQVSEKQFRNFRDSIVRKTKDTLVFNNPDTILIKPFVPKEVYRPSVYVYTEKDGNIAISLQDVVSKHYAVKFFEMDDSPLFEIKRVKEAAMLVDKVNFMHAGWFKFELYEDGKLKEKSRFFIPKDL
jgi:hypothetical protein